MVSLFIAAGWFLILAHQLGEQPNVATLLLAFYLAAWSYTFGILALVLALAWRLIGWLCVWLNHRTGTRRLAAESRSLRPTLAATSCPPYN